ncbi:unnamed protein product [Urochloa decumbens]|uniref:DUF7597 domain-containing protein n=1 Tax=Urochloa decumbens TaxID=240449 RepID=A0ABC9B078_9POAL
MDSSLLDPSHGQVFAAKVRSLTGLLVASSHPKEADNFWLIAAFSRSRLKLLESSIGDILQAILGGLSKLFCVVELEDGLFKFSVSFKEVGLMVYDLQSFSCPTFKVFFHLWNEKGLSAARASAISDRGPNYQWVEVNQKNKKKSYAEAASSDVPLTGANCVPLRQQHSVFSRLDFRNISDLDLKRCLRSAKNTAHALNAGSNSNLILKSSFNNGPASQPKSQPAFTVPSQYSKPMGWSACSRCFSAKHTRPFCQGRIRCAACFRLGHLAARCHFPPRFSRLQDGNFFSSLFRSDSSKLTNLVNWFQANVGLTDGAKSKEVPVFSCFSDFFKASLPPGIEAPSSSLAIHPLPTVPRPSTSSPPGSDQAVHPVAGDDLELRLAPSNPLAPALPLTSSPASASPSSQTVPPSTKKTPFSATVTRSPEDSARQGDEMAYRFVDPTPFMPPNCNRVMIPNRRTMTRAVLGGRRERNKDLAIATIEPLPGQEVIFESVEEVLDDFLWNTKEVGYHTIQPTPYGQALVRFSQCHQRDFLIRGSPHTYGNMRISFVEHNKAWNNKRVNMNYEVWLMLLGLNNDFWTQKDLEKSLADFGKLITWQEDPRHLARVIVKARVVELEEIPWFIVCSDGEDFEGESWTAQCEVLQVNMLGGAPGDEDQPPGPDEVNPNFFEFFGYGQPSNGPQNQHGLGLGNGNANANVDFGNGQNQGNQANWGQWLVQQDAQVHLPNGPFIAPPFLHPIRLIKSILFRMYLRNLSWH